MRSRHAPRTDARSGRLSPGSLGSLFLAILCLLAPGPALLAADAAAPPLFSSDSVVQIRIEAPLKTLSHERSDTEYLDGVVHYTDSAGNDHALDVKLQARGRFRREPDTCAFPPIRVNFRKNHVEDTPFAGLDKVKLVTHCKDSASYEQNLLKEYLAYRIFNALTDASFRVRLLQVDYVDSDRGGDPLRRYAFMIEDDDLLAARLGTTRAELQRVAHRALEPAQAELVSVFEYLIGNTDYSMIAGPADDVCCHNVVLLDAPENHYLPVPYDFDFAGIVDARYAEPNPKLRIRSVTTRLYRGYCMHNALLQETLDRMLGARDAIGKLIDTIPGMQDGTRERAHDYVADFYRDIGDPKSVERHFVNGCI